MPPEPTYEAVIRDGRIEWADDPPPGLPAGQPVAVRVTVLGPAPPPADAEAARKARRLAALERGAARGGITSIPDPVAWQREQRRDRPLPGREE